MPLPAPSIRSLLLALAVAAPMAATAQEPTLQDWGFDPSVLVADTSELLRRAPDPAVDGLFQAVHAAAKAPREAQVLCALFDPDADRSLSGLNGAAARLSPASQERFALAVAEVLVAATQNPPQSFDPATARQAMKSAGATAAILHEDFLPGMAAGAGADARCHSFGLLLDALQTRPLAERAAVTRLLLLEGLARVGTTTG